MKRLIAGLVALISSAAHAAPMDDLVAGRTAASSQIAGLVMLVADRDGIVRAHAYGLADVVTARPLTIDTPLRVASISKAVLAIGVMRLVEAGRLDLDGDVSRWLGWRLRNPAYPAAPVTLRQLLSHTSGVVDGPGYNFSLETTLRAGLTADRWSSAAPGGRFAYANLNYGIIATVMEAATGERFDRLMQRLVLAPLRVDAGYNWSGASDAAIGQAAVLYRSGKDESDWRPQGEWVAQIDNMHGVRPACPVRSDTGCDLAAYRPGTNGTLFSPQGGLRISAAGLSVIGRLLLRGGEVDGVRLLRPASVKALLTPVWRYSARPQDDTYNGAMLCFGAGLQCLSGVKGATDQPVAPGPGGAWWGHLGEAYGLLAGLWIDRGQQRVLVYALTGTRDDPFKPAHRSGFAAVEENIMNDLAATPRRQ